MSAPDLAPAAAEIAAAAGFGDAPLVGVGWATVELDAAADELDAHGPWFDGPREPHLGASSRLGRVPAATAPRVVLLEPDTEGRLAASLARRGEGVAAAWVRVATDPAAAAGEGAGAAGWSVVAHGPFGPERLRLGPAVGPHLLVVLPAR